MGHPSQKPAGKLPPPQNQSCSIPSPLKSASRKRGEGRCPASPKRWIQLVPEAGKSTSFSVSVLPPTPLPRHALNFDCLGAKRLVSTRSGSP